MNFGRKMMKAGVAAVAAIATLGAGGVVASTAFAGGGGGNQPGTGGDLAAVQFWQYKDDASGAWGRRRWRTPPWPRRASRRCKRSSR